MGLGGEEQGRDWLEAARAIVDDMFLCSCILEFNRETLEEEKDEISGS